MCPNSLYVNHLSNRSLDDTPAQVLCDIDNQELKHRAYTKIPQRRGSVRSSICPPTQVRTSPAESWIADRYLPSSDRPFPHTSPAIYTSGDSEAQPRTRTPSPRRSHTYRYWQCKKSGFQIPTHRPPASTMVLRCTYRLMRYVEKVAQCDTHRLMAVADAMRGRPVSGSGCAAPQNSVCLDTRGIILLLLSLKNSVCTRW